MRLNFSNLLIITGVIILIASSFILLGDNYFYYDSTPTLTTRAITDFGTSSIPLLAPGQGIQTRTCVDINCNSTENGPPEVQQCIFNIGDTFVEFLPTNRFIVIAPGEIIDFSGNIVQNDGDLISVNWYLNNVFSKGDSGSTTLYSTFTRNFTDNSRVTARAQVISDSGTFNQEENWYITINRTAELNCVENWYCDWTQCDASGYRYTSPDKCQDLNECGTTSNLTFSESCSCIPEYNCGDWEMCQPKYDIANALYGVPSLDSVQQRTCSQTTSCLLENSIISETQDCNLQIPVTVEIVEWCYQDYVEIRNENTNELVARMKGTTVGNIFSVDIGFSATEYSGTCPYCFDGIKNFDESGIDCGGVCPKCIAKGRYFDYIPFIISFIWIIFALIASAYMYLNKDELLEITPEERKKSITKKSIFSVLLAGIKDIKLPSIFRRTHREEIVKASEAKRVKEIAKPIEIKSPAEKRTGFRFPGININISLGRPTTSEAEPGRIETYTPKTIHEIAAYKPRRKAQHEQAKPTRTRIPLPFGDLRRMLARWKKVPIYATPPKEYRLRKAISEYMKRRKEKKHRKAITKHQRRIKRAERRLVRKQIKHLKRRIRKKQVAKHEISSLKAQLNEWRKKGYYNTYKLEKKLDKLHK